MRFIDRVGWVLLTYVTIGSGIVLPGIAAPGVAAPIAAPPIQAPLSSELETAIATGLNLLKTGDKPSLTAAIVQFERALALTQTADQNTQRALVLIALARVYEGLGQPVKTLDYYQQALPMLQAIGSRSSEAKTLNLMGGIYSDLGEQPKALDYYNQARSIWRDLGDRAGEAKTLSNIGLVYSNLGEKSQALDYYNQALPIRRAVGDRSGEASTLINIGAVYADLGDRSKAIDYFNQALLMSQAVGDRANAAITLNNLGSVYSALGEKSKALDYYHQALPMSRAVGDRLGVGVTLNNIGSIYDDRGEAAKALDYYNQALLIRRTTGDRLGEATTLNNIASVYDDRGETTQALDYYNQALLIWQAVGDRAGAATTLNNMGTIYAPLGDRAKARDYYQQALVLRRAVGARSGEAITLANLATLDRTQNKLTDALQNIDRAIQILESLRSELKTDALKTSYFASVQGYYQFKIQMLMQLHQQQPTQGYAAQALETADQSRARVLRELLIQANAKINKDISPDLRQQEQTLNQTIDAQETQLVQLSSQPGNTITKITTLNQTITGLYTQRDDLKNTIRATNPAYANLQYPKPTTLAQIQQQLDPDTLILQYSLGEPQSYLWVIGQTSLKTYILPKASDIKPTVAAFRRDLIAETRAPNSAIQLTQQILAPAAADLKHKRLVIIPDGMLHVIPFAALNTPNSTTYNPLITQHEITNLPSASTIGILRSTVATKPRGPKKLAILADPIFRKDDDRLAGKTIQANNQLDVGEQIVRSRVGRDLDLNRLPFTATEAQGILKLVPDERDRTAAFGFDASYDWITDPKISQYRYVHLATHGFFDSGNPALSSIILSSFDAKGHDRKAYLRFPDLFNLNLPAELVVLSACETGLGNDVPGEGLVGMTRGLMYAGALRVAVSLWSVDDQATSDLMQDFYKNLWQSKQSHAAALRQAQLKLHQQGKAPYYWAAFTLQGEWRN
jgi:CHAT domain-containing protein/predicted negative regulator of RcsB-dependent stress response